MQMSELIDTLEKEYPNDLMRLKDKTDKEREVAIAQVEMIEFIKSLEKDK